MELLRSALINPQDWSDSQWLAVCIALFVVCSLAYFLFRVFRIARSLNRKPRRPNIGRARLRQALNREQERRQQK